MALEGTLHQIVNSLNTINVFTLQAASVKIWTYKKKMGYLYIALSFTADFSLFVAQMEVFELFIYAVFQLTSSISVLPPTGHF